MQADLHQFKRVSPVDARDQRISSTASIFNVDSLLPRGAAYTVPKDVVHITRSASGMGIRDAAKQNSIHPS
jgi:hypothetical protein